MILTFFIEVTLAAHVIWKYKMRSVPILAVCILLALAAFQLAEYNVCETAFGLSSLDWARFGFVAITLLPPLGIHFAVAMAGQLRRLRWLLAGIYALAAAFVVTFLMIDHGIQGGPACLGNYAIFHVAPTTTRLYAIYYYGLLFFGIWLALYFAQKTSSTLHKRAHYSLIVGYLAFIVPTTTVNVIDPSTIAGIPSIMCGFAVLLALILVGYTLPAHHTGQKSAHAKRRATKIIVTILGWLVLLAGIIMIPYPGPGWATVFAGLAILAREYTWAHNVLKHARARYDAWAQWLSRQPIYVRAIFFALTTLVVVVTLWLLNAYGLIARLLGLDIPFLDSPLPFL
jgi:uncharacterized protein (TIGR02611 family)